VSGVRAGTAGDRVELFGASDDGPESAFRIIARACFIAASLTALLAAAILAFAAPTLTPAARLALARHVRRTPGTETAATNPS